jgi:hypothetical protein
VVTVGSDIPASSIQRIELVIRGIAGNGSVSELSRQEDVFHYGAGMTRVFPGNLIVYQEMGFVGVEVALHVFPTMGAGADFTNRARANFVSGDWRQLDMYLPLQCTDVAVQQVCATQSASGMDFACGSNDVSRPCVAVARSALPQFNERADAGTDAGSTDTMMSGPDSSFPAWVPENYPWAGASISAQQVPFRWRLLPGAVRGTVRLYSDLTGTSELNAVAATDRATLKIEPGRYAYKVEQYAMDDTLVGTAVIRPFEVVGYGHDFGHAIGTSMFLNATDVDRDFAFGARSTNNVGVINTQIGALSDTFAPTVGVTDNPSFGRAIANAGDFNGDGFSDVLIAAQLLQDAQTRATYIALRTPNGMNPRGSLFARLAFQPPMLSVTQPVYAVAGGGDINSDGFADIVLGMPSTNGGTGVVQVIRGHENPTPQTVAQAVLATITGSTAFFGSQVVSGCDFDSDGYADFAVGSATVGALPINSLPVRVYFGGPTVPYATVDVAVPMPMADRLSRRFGATLACGADLNGDGFGELVIGDPDAVDLMGNPSGWVQAWSFEGRTPQLKASLLGPTSSRFGAALTMGVVPFNDLQVSHVMVVGAPNAGAPRNIGEVRVYRMNAAGDVETALTFNNFLPNALGGSSLAIAEVNGYGTAGNPRGTMVLMGVPGPCVDDTMMMPSTSGCIYGLLPANLTPGVTTNTINKLHSWAPVTGDGVGISMAH